MSGSFNNMEKIKRFLKRWPRTYSFIHGAYYKALFAAERTFLGTKINQVRWRRKRDYSVAELMQDVKHPHRPYLVSQIEKQLPFKSVLEVGCHAGANLMLLAKRFPNVTLEGIDINEHFIDVGKEAMAKEGIKNVSLALGTADNLSHFEDKSMDITFTDATLMYVGPDQIMQTLKEIQRVTRKAILFNEWCFEDAHNSQHSVWYYLHWVHDFKSLLQDLSPSEKVTLIKLPAHLWGKDGWQEYGTLVEVTLS